MMGTSDAHTRRLQVLAVDHEMTSQQHHEAVQLLIHAGQSSPSQETCVLDVMQAS